jgi:hypothetical protein
MVAHSPARVPQALLTRADAPPCDRCKATGRESLCEFPPPGTSAIHRRPKRPRHRGTPTLPSPSNAALASPASAASYLETADPFDLLTDEVKNSYLRCSYKWSFHHTPTLLLRIRDRTLDVWMVWAILALSIRCDRAHHHPPLTAPLTAPDS